MQNSPLVSDDQAAPASTAGAAPQPKLTALVPITERHDDIVTVYQRYLAALRQCELPFEIIYVLDGDYPNALRSLREIQVGSPQNELKLVVLPKSFGEATAITTGAEHAAGDWIITLPAYMQVDSSAIPELVAARDSADMIIARRVTSDGSAFNRFQSAVFNTLASSIAGLKLKDSGCNVRLFRKSILREVQLYGDLHRFLPLIAHSQGFAVREIDTRQAPEDRKRRVYRPGLYIRRLLDLLAVYLLLRFTKKPFRFFGLIGGVFVLLGGALMVWLGTERIFFAQPLADRPILVLASLLLVFGIQIISVGLLGEIVIFSNAKNAKEYAVAKVIEAEDPSTE